MIQSEYRKLKTELERFFNTYLLLKEIKKKDRQIEFDII